MDDPIVLLRKVPSWAKWLAKDMDGDWCVFDGEPIVFLDNHQWQNLTKDGRRLSWAIIFTEGPGDPDWHTKIVKLD